jgi:hypothetical protein
MAENTAHIDELRAEVAELRATLAAHTAAMMLIAGNVEDEMPRRDRLRVISGSGRRRTARRGKLAIVSSARPLAPCSDGTQAASGGC